jgi:hypothetical protein
MVGDQRAAAQPSSQRKLTNLNSLREPPGSMCGLSRKKGKCMNRSQRVSIAQETVAIVGGGRYVARDGRTVDIAEAVRRCKENTRFCTPREIAGLCERVLSRPAEFGETRFEVVNETTPVGHRANHGPRRAAGGVELRLGQEPRRRFLEW